MKSKRRTPAEIHSNEVEHIAPHEQCLRVQDEIWRVVSEAVESGASVAAGSHAARIAGKFRESGLAPRAIVDALVYAAVDAGVALEMQPPASRQAMPAKHARFSLAALRGSRPENRTGNAASFTPGALEARP